MYQVIECPFRFDLDMIFLFINGEPDLTFGSGEGFCLVLSQDVGF
jgi:hypothetical protein